MDIGLNVKQTDTYQAVSSEIIRVFFYEKINKSEILLGRVSCTSGEVKSELSYLSDLSI